MDPLRVIYAAGTGDIISTYRCWSRSMSDLSEVALTYSEQFYSVCEELNAQAWVISSHSRPEMIRDGRFLLEHRPIPLCKWRGLPFHIGKIFYSLRFVISALVYRANVAIVAGGVYWFSLALLGCFGIRIIPSLHCA